MAAVVPPVDSCDAVVVVVTVVVVVAVVMIVDDVGDCPENKEVSIPLRLPSWDVLGPIPASVVELGAGQAALSASGKPVVVAVAS